MSGISISLPHLTNVNIKVLVVCDGYTSGFFSFSKDQDASDTYFTLTQFVKTLRDYNNTEGYQYLSGLIRFELTLATRDDDNGLPLGPLNLHPPNLLPGTIVNAFFNWKGSPAVPSDQIVSAVDLSQFDVIFMFGFDIDQTTPMQSGTNLCWDGNATKSFSGSSYMLEDQLWAFVQFMNAGGGIFAAGDHEDRGAALCGSIPRVRSMRRWWWDRTNPSNYKENGAAPEGPYGDWNYGISFVFSQDVAHPFNRDPYQSLGDMCSAPGLGPYRLDTVQPGKKPDMVNDIWVHPGYPPTPETGVAFDRQSDDIPQPLVVTTKHPILALGGNLYLSFLPDHMHEGLVIGTDDPAQVGPMPTQQTFEHGGTLINEYPKTTAGGQPLPQVIAQVRSLEHATPSDESNFGGALDRASDAPFGAISVYEGHIANVGRIVTQSSFHHFLDINLLGDPTTWVAGGTNRRGFTEGAAKAYLTDFEMYWSNLVIWLAPEKLKFGIMFVALDKARRNSSIRMVHRPEMALSGNAVHDIGQMVAQHLDSELPTPMLEDVVHSSLEPEHRTAIREVFARRRRAVPHVVNQLQRVFLHGFLGGATLHALKYPATASFQTQHEAIRPKLMSAGLQGAARSLAVSQHRAVVSDLVEALHKFGGTPRST